MTTRMLLPSATKLGAAAAGVAFFLSSVALAGLKPTAPANVVLSGTWVINEELSDDPESEERMGDMHSDMDISGGGSAGARRIEKHGDAGAGSPPMPPGLEIPKKVQLEQGVESMTLTTDDGSVSCQTTETTQVSTPDGGVADRRCGWDGNEFVIEFKSPEGFTRRDGYALSEDGTRLNVTTSVRKESKEGRMPGYGLTIRRVYERAEAI